MTDGSLDLRPVSSALGAEIRGLDLSRPLDEDRRREVRAALNKFGVLFFRGQTLTPVQHAAFAESFGTLARPRTPMKDHPFVAEVRKEPEATRNIGGNWHTDEAYEPTPDLGSVLVARELPNTGGGDTLFAGMYAAYDGLSAGLKQTLEGLRAVHAKSRALDPANRPADRRMTEAELRQNAAVLTREAIHPVAPRHPESGRRVLYVSPTYTTRFEGWTAEESRPLLDYLFAQGSRPENTCRFRWEVGSVAFWDNRSVWHRALNDYHGWRRLMHRVSIAGKGFGPP
jgi:taurine dioxygenase